MKFFYKCVLVEMSKSFLSLVNDLVVLNFKFQVETQDEEESIEHTEDGEWAMVKEM